MEQVSAFVAAGDTVLIAAQGGLNWRSQEGVSQSVTVLEVRADHGGPFLFTIYTWGETGWVDTFLARDDSVLIGAEKGLFRLDDGLVRLGALEETGRVLAFFDEGDSVLIGAEEGLFRLDDGGLVRLDASEETGWVWAFFDEGETVLIGADEGIFRLDDDGGIHHLAANQEMLQVRAFFDEGETVLIGASGGLFRLADDRLARLDASGETGGGLGVFRRRRDGPDRIRQWRVPAGDFLLGDRHG